MHHTLAALALLGAAWMAGCAPSSRSATTPPGSGATDVTVPAGATALPAPVKLMVAYSARSANTTPLWLAYEQGYFTQEALDVELGFFSSTLAAQALLADTAQMGLIGAEGIDLNLENGGAVTKYIAGVTPKLVFKVVSRPDIGSVADLRGRTVATTRRGAVSDFALRQVLLQAGLQPDTDVAFTYPGTTEASTAALIAGHVDAIAAGIPNDLQAVQAGMKMLVDIERQNVPFLMAGIIGRTDYLVSRPDVVERFLRAYLHGVATTLSDAELATSVMGKYQENDDREQLRYAYDTYRPTWSRDQLMPEAAIVATLAESVKPGARTANPRDFYDNAFLERIKAAGYVDALYASAARP
jgi:ABC-type nitrate/sulfonate/bicarbonate transport system substrate-binding protein